LPGPATAFVADWSVVAEDEVESEAALPDRVVLADGPLMAATAGEAAVLNEAGGVGRGAPAVVVAADDEDAAAARCEVSDDEVDSDRPMAELLLLAVGGAGSPPAGG
jgi:hypothetical protein